MRLNKRESRLYLPKPRFQLEFDILMGERNEIIIIESFVSISQEHVLMSKLKARLNLVSTDDFRV